MKKIALFCFSILVATTGFADSFVLNNQAERFTDNKKSKIAILWASSGKNVEESNKIILQGKKLNPKSLQVVTHLGKNHFDIPKNTEYFRVLVWSKGEIEPSLLTNWVEIVPNKTYTLNEDYLIPRTLTSGMGC